MCYSAGGYRAKVYKDLGDYSDITLHRKTPSLMLRLLPLMPS